MTTATRTDRSTSPSWIFAVGGAAASMALTAYGSFKEEVILPGDVPGWLFINVPIIIVATALVFGLVVSRVLRSDDPEAGARAALVLSLVGLATVIVANFGFPAVLAAGALCAATAARRRTGRWTGVGGVAVVLSVVAVAGATLFAIVG
jgi:hypothetical protein